MGNKCSTKTANPLFDETNLNDYDREIFNLKRQKVFYGTIAICVLYGSFAFILFILSFFSDKIKYLLLNSFLPFTIVYVIGTILIIIYLITQVLNFKPYKINKDGNYDNLSCPDYWNLEYINTDGNENLKYQYTSNFEDHILTNNLFRYRCTLNNNIFNNYDIFKANSNLNTSGIYDSKYHFFNVNSNAYNSISLSNSNIDIIDDKSLLNNGNYPFAKNILYADLNYQSTSNEIRTKIFKNKDNLRYEMARAALLMNNYKVLNYGNTANTNILGNSSYTDFYKENTSIEYQTPGDIQSLLEKLGIKYLDYKYNQSSTADNSPSNYVGDKIIRVYNNGVARVCDRPSGEIFDSTTTPSNCSISSTEADSPTNGTKATVLPLNCESVYPQLLATFDKKINENDRNMDTNIFRCAYSKYCGVPWSDLNCDKYDDE